MKKNKFKKKIIPLDNEAIKRIRKNEEEVTIQLQSTVIAYEALKKQLELDIPMRQFRRDLISFEENISRLESNLKVLRKQIREKSMVQLVPKEVKNLKSEEKKNN